jgi:hypothetical protein
MQKKMAVLIIFACLVATPFITQVHATPIFNWTNLTAGYDASLSPSLSTFNATFVLSGATFDASHPTRILLADSQLWYGWGILIDPSATNKVTITDNWDGSPVHTLSSIPSSLAFSFDGSHLYVNSVLSTSSGPSVSHITVGNPITDIVGQDNPGSSVSGSITGTIVAYSASPSPTPTPTPTPTPSPTPTPTPTSTPTPTPTVYSTTSDDFNENNYFIFDQTLSSSIDTSNPFTIAVHFQNMPNASAVNSGWNQCYRLWFEGTADVFTVEFDVVNAYHSDIITQTGNLTQFRNNVGTLVVNGGLYLANPITHNDTVTLTGNGSQLSVYFGSTLVGTDTMSSSVITKIETTGFEMLAPDISPPVSGSGATVSIYNSVIAPTPSPTPTPTATPTSHHGGGGSQPTYAPTSTPSSTPSQSPNPSSGSSLPVAKATVTAIEVFAVTVFIAVAVASWMFLASRRRR